MLYNIEVNRETTIIKREYLRKTEKKEAKRNANTQALVHSMAEAAENSETHGERLEEVKPTYTKSFSLFLFSLSRGVHSIMYDFFYSVFGAFSH